VGVAVDDVPPAGPVVALALAVLAGPPAPLEAVVDSVVDVLADASAAVELRCASVTDPRKEQAHTTRRGRKVAAARSGFVGLEVMAVTLETTWSRRVQLDVFISTQVCRARFPCRVG
jgi:hypothetical protein